MDALFLSGRITNTPLLSLHHQPWSNYLVKLEIIDACFRNPSSSQWGGGVRRRAWVFIAVCFVFAGRTTCCSGTLESKHEQRQGKETSGSEVPERGSGSETCFHLNWQFDSYAGLSQEQEAVLFIDEQLIWHVHIAVSYPNTFVLLPLKKTKQRAGESAATFCKQEQILWQNKQEDKGTSPSCLHAECL